MAGVGEDLEPGARKVLEYWFGKPLSNIHSMEYDFEERLGLWFGKGNDEEIKREFGSSLEAAEKGQLRDTWGKMPMGTVAEIILLDQFSRNVYRGSGKMFSNDTVAQGLARGIATSPVYDTLGAPAKLFVCVALEHSEQLEDHLLNEKLFTTEMERLEANKAPAIMLQAWKSCKDFADVHREEVQRFGRFPHRNKALGRTSTPEEIKYLESSELEYHKL